MKTMQIFPILLLGTLFFGCLKPLDTTLYDAIKLLEGKAYILKNKAKNTQWLRNYYNVSENTHIYFNIHPVSASYSRTKVILPAMQQATRIAQQVAGQVGEQAVLQAAVPELAAAPDAMNVITALSLIKEETKLSEAEFVNKAINLVTVLMLANGAYILLEKARAQAKPLEADKFISQAQQLLEYGEAL